MALRKPLVIIDGQIQQLSDSDDLNATIVEQEVVTLTNGNGSAIVIGNVVYISGAGEVDLAQADAAATKEAIGLVKETSIASSATGAILTDGVLTATTTQWDAVAGTTGGLVAGTTYYLDPDTPGKLTATAPTTEGDYVVKLGVALSTTEFKLDIEISVLL